MQTAAQDFASRVAARMPANHYGFDWKIILDMVMVFLEECLPQKIADMRSRMDGRFGGYWTSRVRSRIAAAHKDLGRGSIDGVTLDAIVAEFAAMTPTDIAAIE